MVRELERKGSQEEAEAAAQKKQCYGAKVYDESWPATALFWFHCVSSGFLNTQIEHHFFPQCPPFAVPYLQRDVERFCHDQGIPYRSLSFWDASCKMFGGLRDTGRETLLGRKEARLLAKEK